MADVKDTTTGGNLSSARQVEVRAQLLFLADSLTAREGLALEGEAVYGLGNTLRDLAAKLDEPLPAAKGD
ncbi:MAG: hypothetical protein ACEB74_04845 [Desulfovibrio aminophilus]|uniref:hypothetical protein n=1 Tax=Desulfovibrio aminophilus TaxID=81425 RepID=UPI0004111466|nr:hypothetical protein [Desulfovibrio aminophilus]MDY0305909.1 hypothetical protein [Desulfovibrionaceae bacterium]